MSAEFVVSDLKKNKLIEVTDSTGHGKTQIGVISSETLQQILEDLGFNSVIFDLGNASYLSTAIMRLWLTRIKAGQAIRVVLPPKEAPKTSKETKFVWEQLALAGLDDGRIIPIFASLEEAL